MFNTNGFLNDILDRLVMGMPPPLLNIGIQWNKVDDDNDNEEALYAPRKTTASCITSKSFGRENVIIDRRGSLEIKLVFGEGR